MKRRFQSLTKTDTGHCELILSSLKRLKRSASFCDVIIKSGKIEIQAHRNVLAAASEYFEDLFLQSRMNEHGYGMLSVIDLSDIPFEAVGQCMDFIYSGEVDFFGTDVQLLLKTAEKLHLPALSKLCLKDLLENINLDNCITVIGWVHCRRQDSFDASMKRFLTLNLKDFIRKPGFPHLELNELVYCLGLLQGDDGVEVEKWNGVLEWVNFDLEARQQNFPELFQMVDMTCFTKELLQQILKNPLIGTSCSCLKSVASIVTEESFGYASMNSEADTKRMTHIISCRIGSQIIVKYEVRTKKWSRITAFPGEFNNHCDVISHGNNIYVGTGNQIYAYVNGKWDTKVFRTKVTCQRCRGVYWHVGKKENIVESAGSVYLSSLEPQMVPIEIGEQMITCNKCHYSFIHTSSLDMEISWCYPPTNSCYNRCIATDKGVYMLTLDCILHYSLDTQKVSCQSFPGRLGNGFFITASQDRIFAMGGTRSEKRVVEYNLTTRRILTLADMITQKPTGHAFWYKEKLYAMGGMYPAKLDVYSPCANQWTLLPDLTIPQEPTKIFLGDGLFLVGKSMSVKRIDLKNLQSLNYEEGNNSDANTIICPAHFKSISDSNNV